jgi:two-component system cell cycle response regulator DivK
MERTILIVDDAQDFRETCALFLSLEGFRVLAADNGKEAVEMASDTLPTLILMDLSLPVMDGLEASKRIKHDKKTRHIPVILLTGHTSKGARAVIEAGCEGFLVKPCTPKKIVEEIERVLRRSTIATL